MSKSYSVQYQINNKTLHFLTKLIDIHEHYCKSNVRYSNYKSEYQTRKSLKNELHCVMYHTKLPN